MSPGPRAGGRLALPGADPTTPVYVLTGFLGSGKTTLLRRLIHRPTLADTAVIVNEFGEVGLDHLLVAKGEEDDVVLLDSGCLCCALNNSLNETLTDLFHRRARGEVPEFRRVVIETTGLADPAPILQTLMTDRFLASRYHLAAMLATLDALHFGRQARDFAEAVKQVALADRLILTKTDVAAADQAARIRDRARALNPHAEVLDCAAGEIDPGALLAPPPAGLKAGEPIAVGPTQGGHDHGRHAPGITTYYRPVPAPVTWPTYDAFVRAAQRQIGAKLLRVKGLLRFEGEPAPRVIQGVQHLFAPPEPFEGGAVGQIGLVFIVQDQSAEAIDTAMLHLTITHAPNVARS